VPVVALAYDPKVVNTMKALGADGMTLDLAEVGALAEKVGEAMADSRYRSTIHAVGLIDRASLNAKVLTDALERHQPDEDPVSREAASLALRHLEIGALLQDQEALTRRMTKLEADRERLQGQWDHLVGSRSMRVVNSWWTIRNRFKRSPVEADPDSEFRRRYERELDEILETHQDAAGIVIYPPTIGWAAQLFQRPQQMARAFARMGYLTFFGVDWGGPEEVRGFRYEGDRLCLTGLPLNLLPILERVPNPLMISYVYNFEFRKYLSNPTTIFEHIDHLDVFASSFPTDQLGSWFDEAARDAEVVAASARDLQVEMLPTRPDTILCPNGVTFEHFAGYRPGPVPSDLERIVNRGRPIVGYYGAIAEWVDYDLIDFASERLHDYSFVFIGPNYDKTMDEAAVFKRENVWWLGPKSYDVLPGYLHHFSVATIPFKVNDVTHSVSPLKLFEYMAGGKPVVTTAMREAQHYEQVLVAHDPDEWVKHIVDGVARGRDPSIAASLQRTARANTWDQRVGTLIDAASKKR
jgi:glycosyltransferase involved in cell wall biosynthesis